MDDGILLVGRWRTLLMRSEMPAAKSDFYLYIFRQTRLQYSPSSFQPPASWYLRKRELHVALDALQLSCYENLIVTCLGGLRTYLGCVETGWYHEWQSVFSQTKEHCNYLDPIRSPQHYSYRWVPDGNLQLTYTPNAWKRCTNQKSRYMPIYW